jgi:hypothetical protein
MSLKVVVQHCQHVNEEVLLFVQQQTNRLLMVLKLAVSMPIICTKNNLGTREVTKKHIHGYQSLNDAISRKNSLMSQSITWSIFH